MKKLMTIAILMFIALGVNAQSFNRNIIGLWGGTVENTDTGKESYMGFNFEYDSFTKQLQCHKLTKNDEGEIVNDNRFTNSSFTYQTNNAVYTWVNSGGIWSETQSYLFTLTEGKLQILHIRMVNNDKEGVTEGEVWGYMQAGFLEKLD